MPVRRKLPTVAAALAAGCLAAPAALPAEVGPWRETPQCRVRLVSPYAAAPAEGELRLGLHVELAEGWHSYWKNSGDAGYPPEVDFAATPEVTGARLLWPAPERYEVPGGLVAYGYEEEVVYPLRVELAAAGEERVRIRAEVDYVVCEVECVPYRHTLTLEQPLAREAPVPDPEVEPLLAAWEARVPLAPEELPGVTTAGWLETGAEEEIRLTVEVAGGAASPETSRLFLEVHERFEAGTPRAGAKADGVRFTVPLYRRNLSLPAPRRDEFAWTVTGLEAAGRPVSLEARREVGPPGAAPEPAGAGERGLAALLARVFAGGVLLVFTPGVIALLVLAAAELRRRGEGGGGSSGAPAAAAGVLVTGLVLVGTVLALRGGGREAGWGSQFQEPALLAAAAVALLLLALHLWGVVALPGGVRGAPALPPVVAGLLAPLLVLPFDPPGLAPALNAALARGPAAGLAAGAAWGLGLALPWLALASPAVSRRLLARRAHTPAGDPGRAAVRDGLWGFLPAAGLIWVLYLLAGLLPSPDLAFVELALLVLALCVWLRRRVNRGIMRAVFAAGVVLAGGLAVALAL